MQESTSLIAFKETLLNSVIKRNLKGQRSEFCDMFDIAPSTLSRIINLKINCSDVIFDNLCYFCNIDLFLDWHKKGHYQI